MMARRRAGLTQRQLAERLGLRQATIARWERGDRGVSVDDVELVAHACGLQLDAHLLVEDRSWWPQIAMQLELDPLERVRRLTPPGAPDIAAGLSELAAAGVFRARHRRGRWGAAWLAARTRIVDDRAVWVCRRRGLSPPTDGCSADPERQAHPVQPSQRRRRRGARRHGGEADLARNRVAFETPAGSLDAAGLIDLLRIADASDARTARRDSLALQAVLDVQREREAAGASDNRAAGERLAEWLSQQTPVA